MNICQIIKSDTANGPGMRLSLFVSGCTRHCPGCFNSETWDFGYGIPWTKELQKAVLDELGKDHYQGISILGGEPFEVQNQEELMEFIWKVGVGLPFKDIWVYTGYNYEDLLPCGRQHTKCTDEILKNIDVLVDGSFVEARKDPSLAFRGSENQRIIDMQRTRDSGVVTLYCK